MKDEILSMYEQCPSCGSAQGLYYSFQVPFIYEQKLDRTYCSVRNGKIHKMTKKELLAKAKAVLGWQYQMAQCCCNLCGWVSEPIIP